MKTVVLLSGGVDSAVLLADRVAQGDIVLCLSFDYGQRHRRELVAAANVARLYGCRHELAVLPSWLFGGSALTGGADLPLNLPSSDPAQAATVVPGRNLAFVSCAVALAASRGYDAVAVGCHHGDAAVYPDCRVEFLVELAQAVERGYGIRLTAPFLVLSKGQVVARGMELGVDFSLTWSCYQGAAQPCGGCGACKGRAEAGL